MQRAFKGPRELERYGMELAGTLLPEAEGRPLVVALVGELGAGKTTLVRAFAHSLGVQGPIISPTFLLVKEYSLPRTVSGKERFVHVDAYRLKGSDELRALGLDRIIADSRTVVAVEWADRVRDIVPPGAVWLTLTASGQDTRSVAITYGETE